jgi:hypothetical protein
MRFFPVACFFLVFSLFRFAPATAELSLAEHRALMRCYDPGMFVKDINVIHESCTRKITQMGERTQDIQRLVVFMDIVSSVHSLNSSLPLLKRSLKINRTETCSSLTAQRLLVESYRSNLSDDIFKCRPFTPNLVSGFFFAANRPEARQKLCSGLRNDLKKLKLEGFCSEPGESSQNSAERTSKFR